MWQVNETDVCGYVKTYGHVKTSTSKGSREGLDELAGNAEIA